MELSKLHYQLADEQILDHLLSNIEAFWFEETREIQGQRCYYDSFDWRLYQHKHSLYTETYQQQTKLYWLRSEYESDNTIIIDKMPVFAEDLADSWQTVLKPLLAMRALIPKAQLNVRIQEYRCLNRYEKTILRIYISHYQNPDQPSDNSLPISLSIVPIRGYPKPYLLMQERIAKLNLTPNKPQRLLKRSLKLSGKKANDYSSKLRLKLDEKLDTASACRLILATLHNSLECNHAGTCADIDSEFLHDFRVAGRRSRALLSQIKTAFAPTQTQFLKTELAWLSQITSPTRDADVYLLKFESYQQRIPQEMQNKLDPFKIFLQQHQKICQQMLKDELESPRYQSLMQNWQKFTDTETKQFNDNAPDANTPIKTLAALKIDKAARRLYKAGILIDNDSPAEALHDLRKLAKKLRYLLEFFQSLYDQTQIKTLVKNLKILQNNLGDFQDFEVQAAQIQIFAEQMQNQYHASTATLMAMGALSATLLQGQAQMRAGFADCFQIFATDKERYQQLFKHSKPADQNKEGVA